MLDTGGSQRTTKECPVPHKNISNAQTKTEKNNCSILYLKNTRKDYVS
jgi:hypothetical protein